MRKLATIRKIDALTPIEGADKIEVAIIGAGRMGQIHGPNAARHPDLRLRYVIETDPALGQALAAQTGASIATLGDALGDPAIKGVIIDRRDQVLIGAFDFCSFAFTILSIK